MNISIKRINGDVIFSGDFESLKACVEAAAKQKTNLRGVYWGLFWRSQE